MSRKHTAFSVSQAPGVIAILLKLFQKREGEGTLPNSFYKASITLTPKPGEGTTSKASRGPRALMSADAEALDKMPAR